MAGTKGGVLFSKLAQEDCNNGGDDDADGDSDVGDEDVDGDAEEQASWSS